MTVTKETEAEIRRLHFGEKWPIGTIVTQLGVHEDVVRRVVKQLEPRKSTVPRPRLVDPYIEFIEEKLERYPTLRATRLHDMLVQRGFSGSVRTLREFVSTARPRPKVEAFLSITPIVGEQAQVDWAHVGQVAVPGGARALWLFVMLLRWSRALWGEFVFDLRAPAVARSLVRATRYFGGSARQHLFDNPKSVVVERHGNAVRFHPLVLDVEKALAVEPRACRPRRPTDKGGVERAIRYLRERFLAARHIDSIERGNRELLEFIDKIAMPRRHPEFRERTVGECFAEERLRLLPLPEYLPSTDEILPVSVDKLAFVQFDRNRYSVPPSYAGRVLTVAADDRAIRMLDVEDEIARHARCWGRRQKIEDKAHREALEGERAAAQKARASDRLRLAAPDIDLLLERWVQAERNVGNMIGQAVRLLDLYGTALFAAAVREVIERGTHDPGALANICEQHRRACLRPVPIDVCLAPHVPDRDVVPHDLETYDEER